MTILDSLIDSLRNRDEDFELTDEGSIDKYIGVLIKDINNSSFEMIHPFLVQRIIVSLSFYENKTIGRINPVGKPLLNRDLDICPINHKWIYRGAVCMLSHLENGVRPEI